MSREVKLIQPEKASEPIEVTLWGIVAETNPLQPLKASLASEVTPSKMMVFLQPNTNLFVPVSITALQLSRLSYFVHFLQ